MPSAYIEVLIKIIIKKVGLIDKKYYFCEVMNFHKLIISLILLLTYSFGFAHNLVPHCTDSGEENHNHSPSHNHHFHFEGEAINSEHADIVHDDHFDKGVYDFITCLVHESESPEEECSIEHCFTFSTNNFSLDDINKIQTAILLFVVFQPIVQNELIEYFSIDVEINYLSPLLEDSPPRGPPYFNS